MSTGIALKGYSPLEYTLEYTLEYRWPEGPFGYTKILIAKQGERGDPSQTSLCVAFGQQGDPHLGEP
jgi:hypothetical protein